MSEDTLPSRPAHEIDVPAVPEKEINAPAILDDFFKRPDIKSTIHTAMEDWLLEDPKTFIRHVLIPVAKARGFPQAKQVADVAIQVVSAVPRPRLSVEGHRIIIDETDDDDAD